MTNASHRRLLWFFLASTSVAFVLSPSRADDKPEPKKPPALPPVLRWGADFGGGEPYVIGDPKNPSGFEAELAQYLAKKLGIKSEAVSADWDALTHLLERKEIDLVLNGYEWSAEREKVMLSTVPYYAYRLRLIVRRDNKQIRDWDELKPGTTVGVLQDSAAERYLKDSGRFTGLAVRSYREVTTVLRLVEEGALDATVQDEPVVSWYLQRRGAFPNLRAVGDPIAPTKTNYYVIFVRPEDRELRDKLNEAITEGLKDGSIRKIYRKYGIWPDEEEPLLEAGRKWPPEEAAETGTTSSVWPLLGEFVVDLGRAALWTVLLTLVAMPLAMLAGLLVALGRLYGPSWLAVPLGVYVEVIRGTPILFQLVVIAFMLPNVGIVIPIFWAGVLGLAINYSAYEAENYRAGLLAIPEGQTEAALALGMSRITALRRVVVPQAVRLVLPPVTNDFISLFKDTSICSAIAVPELMKAYQSKAQSFPRLAVYAMLITACLYLLMSYPLSLLARRMEAKKEEEEDAAA